MPSSSVTSSSMMVAQEEGMIDTMGAYAISLVLFFGVVTFATVGLATRSWLLGDSHVFRLWHQAMMNSPTKLSSTVASASYYTNSLDRTWVLLGFTTLLGCMAWNVYLIQTHPLIGRIVPFVEDDLDLAAFLWLLIFLSACLCSWKRNDEKGSRNGTASSSESEEEATTTDDDDDEEAVETIQLQDFQSSSYNGKSSSSQKSIGSNELESILDHNNGEFDTSHLTSRKTTTPAKKKKKKKKKYIDEDEDVTKMLLEENDKERQKRQQQSSYYNVVPPVKLENDVLNRFITQEWKGLLCVTFLLFGGDVSNSMIPTYYYELGLSCFIFLSGFGHTTYFLTKQDYSYTRMARVLLRMNLSLFCFFLLSNNVSQRMVCWLFSYFFLWIYSAFKLGSNTKKGKFGMRWLGVGMGLVLVCIWDVNLGIYPIIHLSWLWKNVQTTITTDENLWLWYRWTHIHHWSFFVGMIFALNHPICSLWIRKVESIQSVVWRWAAKSIVLVALLAAVIMWNFSGKNVQHLAYFSFVPLLTFVYIRNGIPYLRCHHLGFYKHMGEISYELYILQTTLFSANTNNYYQIVPDFPICNKVLSLSIVYLGARLLKNITMVLISTFLPTKKDHHKKKNYQKEQSSKNDDKQVLIQMGIFGTIIVLLYSISKFFILYQFLNIGSLLSLIIILGILFYQTILDIMTSSSQPKQNGYSTSTIAKVCPPLVGTMTIFLVAIGWHFATRKGASTYSYKDINHPQNVLPSHCSDSLNDGQWTTLSTCNEYHHGTLTRENPTSFVFDCENRPKWQWGWTNNNHHKDGCHFSYRSPSDWQEQLMDDRHVIFMGDTIVRSMYHSTCRAIGDNSVQDFDSSIPLHSDITKTFGPNKSTLKYVWAPLAMDCVSKLRDIATQQQQPQHGKIDLVVLSGGVWDRLHVWATDEDQESHKAALAKLKKLILYLRQEKNISFVWLRPTTINTKALNNEEKRTLMSEVNIQQMRSLYTELGIDEAVNTVIDGPSFTREKVEESYDGVHYPPYVYDVGTQLLGNSLDWLLVPSSSDSATVKNTKTTPQVGIWSNPFLGIMMFCFSLIGLLFFDGYFGFSYLASLCTRDNVIPVSNIIDYYTSKDDATKYSFFFSVMPNDLYEEAMADHYRKWNIKPPTFQSNNLQNDIPLNKTMMFASKNNNIQKQNRLLHNSNDIDDNLDFLTEKSRTYGDDESDAFTFFPSR